MDGIPKATEISYVLDDRRTDGRRIDVLFQGTLQPEQEKAAAAMLERMYQKRLSAYASMGYTIFSPTGDGGANVIYTVRDYQERFWQDFRE